MHVFLETDRLLLRRFTDDDVDNLYNLDSDTEVMRYITGGTTMPREEIECDYLPAFLSYYTRFEGYGFWTVVDKATGRFLGWFHLRPRTGQLINEPELGYRLRREAWGMGYGTEGARALLDKGFSDLGPQRVLAPAFQANLASRRIMEKSGMTLARTYRLSPEQLVELLGIPSPELVDGQVVEYAITRPEWEARHRHERGATPLDDCPIATNAGLPRIVAHQPVIQGVQLFIGVVVDSQGATPGSATLERDLGAEC